MVPWSRFGARQEKGTPENLDLKCGAPFLGGVNYACKQFDNEMSYVTHTLKDYEVTSIRPEQVRVEAVICVSVPKEQEYSAY